MAEQDARGEETPYNMQHAGNIPEVRSTGEFLQLQKDESETNRAPETFLDGKESFQQGAGTSTGTTSAVTPIPTNTTSTTETPMATSGSEGVRPMEPPASNPGSDDPSGGMGASSGGNKGDDVVGGDTVGTTRAEDDTPARQPETRPPPDTDEKTEEPEADADKGEDKAAGHKDKGKGGIARENPDAIPTAGGEKLGKKHWGESKIVPDVPKKEEEGVASAEGQPDQQTKDNTNANTNANTGGASHDGEDKPGLMDKVKGALHMGK